MDDHIKSIMDDNAGQLGFRGGGSSIRLYKKTELMKCLDELQDLDMIKTDTNLLNKCRGFGSYDIPYEDNVVEFLVQVVRMKADTEEAGKFVLLSHKWFGDNIDKDQILRDEILNKLSDIDKDQYIFVDFLSVKPDDVPAFLERFMFLLLFFDVMILDNGLHERFRNSLFCQVEFKYGLLNDIEQMMFACSELCDCILIDESAFLVSSAVTGQVMNNLKKKYKDIEEYSGDIWNGEFTCRDEDLSLLKVAKDSAQFKINNFIERHNEFQNSIEKRSKISFFDSSKTKKNKRNVRKFLAEVVEQVEELINYL